MNPDELRELLRWAYCLSYTKFLKILGWEKCMYSERKFRDMQNNFTAFYCSLDIGSSQSLVNAFNKEPTK